MNIKPPVTFDDGSQFYPDGKEHYWPQQNGRDADGVRITNLVGHNGMEFIKHCPKCCLNKPALMFDITGRVTDELRDQSQCMDCRKNSKRSASANNSPHVS